MELFPNVVDVLYVFSNQSVNDVKECESIMNSKVDIQLAINLFFNTCFKE